MKKIFILIASLILTASCTKKETVTDTKYIEVERTPTVSPVNQGNDSGGMDSSGGDLIKSTKAEVNHFFNSVHQNSAEVLFRLSLEYLFLSKNSLNQIYGPSSYEVLKKLFEHKDYNAQKVFHSLAKKELTLDIKSRGFCSAKEINGVIHHDGSAHGKFPDGYICLSAESFQKIPKESLQIQSTALFVHELSHLFDFNEQDATHLQNIIIKGQRFLLPNQSERDELLNYSNQLKASLMELNFQYKNISKERACSLINKAISFADKLDALVLASLNLDLNRRLPEYITLDIRTTANMAKGLRGFCGTSPVSDSASYNVEKGNDKDLKLKLDQILTLMISSDKRLTTYLVPLNDLEDIQQQMETFTEYVQLSSTEVEDEFQYPKQCYLNFQSKDRTFSKPKNAPVMKTGEYWCFIGDENGNYTYYKIPTYWKPGSKLLGGIARKIEDIFERKITELNIKLKYGDILSYLIKQINQASFPKEHSMLERAGFISKEITKDAKNLFKRTLISAILEFQVGIEFNNGRGNDELHVLFYYGISEGIRFGVINESININQRSRQMMQSLNLTEDYNSRYRQLENQLEQLNISFL